MEARLTALTNPLDLIPRLDVQLKILLEWFPQLGEWGEIDTVRGSSQDSVNLPDGCTHQLLVPNLNLKSNSFSKVNPYSVVRRLLFERIRTMCYSSGGLLHDYYIGQFDEKFVMSNKVTQSLLLLLSQQQNEPQVLIVPVGFETENNRPYSIDPLSGRKVYLDILSIGMLILFGYPQWIESQEEEQKEIVDFCFHCLGDKVLDPNGSILVPMFEIVRRDIRIRCGYASTD